MPDVSPWLRCHRLRRVGRALMAGQGGWSPHGQVSALNHHLECEAAAGTPAPTLSLAHDSLPTHPGSPLALVSCRPFLRSTAWRKLDSAHRRCVQFGQSGAWTRTSLQRVHLHECQRGKRWDLWKTLCVVCVSVSPYAAVDQLQLKVARVTCL